MQNNNPKKFKKFKKAPLAFAIGFLALSAAVFWLVLGKISFNEAEAESAHAKWQTESLRREAIRSLERSIREIAAERTETETHFADSANVVPFLDALELSAESAGAEFEVMSVEIAKEAPELIIALRAEGSFGAIYKFMQLLENSPYELEIASFDIQRLGTESETAIIALPKWEGSFKVHLLSFVKTAQ